MNEKMEMKDTQITKVIELNEEDTNETTGEIIEPNTESNNETTENEEIEIIEISEENEISEEGEENEISEEGEENEISEEGEDKIIKEIKNNFCIICLEHMDDDIMEICDTCEVKCHINCLYDWYKKNNQELCPICLKKTGEINVTNNSLYENSVLIQDYENIIERNNIRRNNIRRNNIIRNNIIRNNIINNAINNEGNLDEARDFFKKIHEHRCLAFFIFNLLLFCIILIYMYTDI